MDRAKINELKALVFDINCQIEQLAQHRNKTIQMIAEAQREIRKVPEKEPKEKEVPKKESK